jgi:hypothetical protein
MNVEFFGLVFDFSFWMNFLDFPLVEQAGILFALGGWAMLAVFLLKEGANLWVEYRSGKYVAKWQQVLLAVDVPPLLIQTPKAVEQIFAHLSGALGGANVQEKFWDGKVQKSFSFEIISIEGYIQFLIRTESAFRDLVEAAIYAQYPEAEITEVEDYVGNIPDSYPNSDYDVMGIEFKLAEPDPYPIRTYPDFAYSLSKDAVFSDPMAAILENFTRIGQGENLWMQVIIQPVDSTWKKKGIELAKSILAGTVKKPVSNPLVDGLFGLGGALMGEVRNVIEWNFEPKEKAKKDDKPKVELTPGTRKSVESIEEKIAKIGFKTKLRLVYAAHKGVYNPSRCLEGFVGAMNQFHIQGRNSIVPFKGTSAKYDKSKKKTNLLKSSFVKAFKGRKMKWKKQDGYILNIEELATIWHFPLPFVKTPLLHKAGHKRSEPPSGLPIEFQESPLKPKLPPGEKPPEELPPPPPEELPYG